MIICRESVESCRNELVAKLGQLVRIPSVKTAPLPGMPFGRPIADALRWILDECESLGLACENVDNYAGHADYGEGEDIVAVITHLDVVPAGAGWSFDPFGGEYRDGRLLGRGAADNKCSAIAALCSVRILKELGVTPIRKIRLIFGTDEESGGLDMRRYFERKPLPDLAFVPDAGSEIINREKGRLLVRLHAPTPDSSIELSAGVMPNIVPDLCEVTSYAESDLAVQPSRRTIAKACLRTKRKYCGKSWHGAWPSGGTNAVALAIAEIRGSGIATRNALLEFISDRISNETDGSSLGIACADKLSGELTLNLGVVKAGRPESESLLDIRYPVTYRSGLLLEAIRNAIHTYGIEMTVVSDDPPLFVDEDSILVRKLKIAHEKATGQKAIVQSMGGKTYASCLGNRGVAFGPGAGVGAHQIDEWVDLDRLMRHLWISTQAMYELAFTK